MMNTETIVFMMVFAAMALFFVVIAAQCHMRMSPGGSVLAIWVAIVMAAIDGGWFGKVSVDYWYAVLPNPPADIWQGACWIGASVIGGVMAGGITFAISRFPPLDEPAE